MNEVKGLKRIIIWGAGNFGKSKLLRDLLELKYEIVAYCDSDEAKWGSCVDGYVVRSINEIAELEAKKAFDMIVIAVRDAGQILSVKKTIESRFSKGSVEICAYSEIGEELENRYIAQRKSELDFTGYKIDYKGQFAIWIDNIMSEVDFWINKVAKEGAQYRSDYCKRLGNNSFRSDPAGNIDSLIDYLCKIKEPLVYDIGCGLTPRFGEMLPNGNKISMVEMDPLAYFYNAINARYAPTEHYKKIVFGMSEYVSKFVKKGSADAVIINNALDHCIDPYKSIVESLLVLKQGGILHLNHARMEGINEKYDGLHQWNLDYTENDDFIIWNYGTAVNVSERLQDVASIQISHTGGYICVEMTKKKNFEAEQCIDVSDEMENMAFVVEGLMKKLSDQEVNSVFHEMLINNFSESS